MNDLARLDARTFRARLGDLLRTEFVALGAFLRALANFERRRLFRDLGYASLFDHLHRGLRLSRGAAHDRRAAAALVQRYPEVLAPIEDGRMCLSTVAVVASVLTEENRAEVLPRFYGLSKQEALEVAAEIKPRAVVPVRTVVTSHAPASHAPVPVPEPLPEGQREITMEFRRFVHPGELAAPPVTVGSVETEGATTVKPMATAIPMTTVEPMTATASRLHVTVSREFLALLERAKSGESHRNPGATDEEILRLGLEALIEKQGKRKASVPAKVKREVVKRDEGKCTWPLPDGGTCGATANLEIDHVHPRGLGGASTVDNCRVLCRAHDLEAARRACGDDVMNLFTRSASTKSPISREEVARYGFAAGRVAPSDAVGRTPPRPPDGPDGADAALPPPSPVPSWSAPPCSGLRAGRDGRTLPPRPPALRATDGGRHAA